MSEGEKAGTSRTIDQLFAEALARQPEGPALADPVNRQLITEGSPRHLTFKEADAAISRLAAHLLALGLKPLDVVLVQLPNTVELPLTLLALSRAGMIAAPVPIAWGLHEVRKAAAGVRPRAILTCGYVQKQQPAERMRFCAFDTPSVRFVLGYGSDLPDGVVGLDDCLWGEGQPEVRPGAPVKPDHLALITFEEVRNGAQALGRSHAQLAGAARQVLDLMALDDTSVLLSPYLLSSLTGLAGGLIGWLTSGCCLVLHHPFSSSALRAEMEKHEPSHLMLPATIAATGTVAPLLFQSSLRTLVLGWPQRVVNIYPKTSARVINTLSLGELALHASPATEAGSPRLPLGPVHTVVDGSKTLLLETRLKGESRRKGDIANMENALEARLQVRGAALPTVLGLESPEDGFRETGLIARPVAAMPPAAEITGQTELLAVGGLRFDGHELAVVYAGHDAVAAARAYNETDDLLGSRLSVTIKPATGEYVGPEDLGATVSGFEMAEYKVPHSVNALADLLPHKAENLTEKAKAS